MSNHSQDDEIQPQENTISRAVTPDIEDENHRQIDEHEANQIFRDTMITEFRSIQSQVLKNEHNAKELQIDLNLKMHQLDMKIDRLCDRLGTLATKVATPVSNLTQNQFRSKCDSLEPEVVINNNNQNVCDNLSVPPRQNQPCFQIDPEIYSRIEPIRETVSTSNIQTNVSNQNSSVRCHQGSTGYTKPNTYDGNTNWSDYKIHFETVAKLNGWSNEIKALQLIACMQGQALATLGDIDTNCPPRYENLIEILTKRFAPQNQTELYRTQLDCRKRKKGENLPELAQDIKRQVRLAYPTAPQDVRDNIAYKCFRDALNDFDLEWAICQGSHESIDEALNFALKYEAFKLSHRPPMLRQISDGTLLAPENSSKVEHKSNPSVKTQGPCYYCGNVGHFKRDCRKRRADNDKYVSQLQNRNPYTKGQNGNNLTGQSYTKPKNISNDQGNY